MRKSPEKITVRLFFPVPISNQQQTRRTIAFTKVLVSFATLFDA